MGMLAEMLAWFDSLALPWQLVVVAGLALGVVMVLVAAQAGVRREEHDWDSRLYPDPRSL